MFRNAFHDLLQITPDIFAKIAIGNSKSKTPIQTKEKSVSKKKNTAKLVQNNRKLVEKKEKEKVLEVWVSIRSCIICNTSKM